MCLKGFSLRLKELGARDFQIDLTPKLFLAGEGLVHPISASNIAHCIRFCIVTRTTSCETGNW